MVVFYCHPACPCGWRMDEADVQASCTGDVTHPRCGTGKQVSRCCRPRAADNGARDCSNWCIWEGVKEKENQGFVWTVEGSMMQRKAMKGL